MPRTLSALANVLLLSIHWLPCIESSAIFFLHGVSVLSMEIERNTTLSLLSSASSFCRCGTSRQHGTHHDAQKSMYTYLPRNSSMVCRLPSASRNDSPSGNGAPFIVTLLAIKVSRYLWSRWCFSVALVSRASPCS